MVFDGRSYAAELTMDAVVSVCEGVTDWAPYTSDATSADAACAALIAWDRRFAATSRGAHVFREAYSRFSGADGLYSTPFDATDPVNTPRDVDLANADVVEEIRQAIADAAGRISSAGLAMDAAWGDLQFREVGAERIPIVGMPDSLGFSVISSSLVDGEGYSRIRHGNSHMQAVTWDEGDACPRALTLLSYSPIDRSGVALFRGPNAPLRAPGVDRIPLLRGGYRRRAAQRRGHRRNRMTATVRTLRLIQLSFFFTRPAIQMIRTEPMKAATSEPTKLCGSSTSKVR